ncbi:MAG: Dabb family protein [Verrucomicrobiales bacterium]|nr:Dabb family protein [Verrucomicrobiales bacterium]
MIRHSVYFWLDESLDSEQKLRFEGGMRALFDMEVVKNGSYGKAADTPERPVTNNDFDYSLFLEFDSVEDHNTYQTHPDHQVFIDDFSQWFKIVKIFDSELA